MTTNIKRTDGGEPKSKKHKKKFKMPSALSIIIGVVIFMAIVTWIPHGGTETIKGIELASDGSLFSWEVLLINKQLINDGADLFINSSGIIEFGDSWYIVDTTNSDNPVLTDKLTPDSVTAAINTINDAIVKNGLSGSLSMVYDSEVLVQISYSTNAGLPFTLTSFNDGTNSRFGLFDTFAAMFGGYLSVLGIALYLVGIYAVVELLMKTHTLKNAVSSLVKGLNGKEILILPVLFFLFSLGGTLFGMQEETLGLLPIIIPIIILAGFDAPAGLLVVVLGTTTGIAASVLDPFSVGVMAAGLGVGIGDGIIYRLILFVIYTSIGMGFVTWYGERVKKDKTKSIEKSALDANEKWAEETIGDIYDLTSMDKKQKAAMWIFALAFAAMVFTILPWMQWITGLRDWFPWTVISSIFFGNVLLGEWYFYQLAIIFIIAALLIGAIFGYSVKGMGGLFWDSFKGMFGVISIIAFSRATSMIMTSSGLTYGMIYNMTGGGVGKKPILFMLSWFVIFSVMAIFIPSTSGLAGITSPIIGGVVDTATSHHDALVIGILMIYPLAQGVMNMFSPTTGLVVIQAEQSKVNFGRVMPWLAGYAAVIAVVGVISASVLLWIEGLLNPWATQSILQVF